MGLASCVPTRAYRFSDRAGLHLPFHTGQSLHHLAPRNRDPGIQAAVVVNTPTWLE